MHSECIMSRMPSLEYPADYTIVTSYGMYIYIFICVIYIHIYIIRACMHVCMHVM